MYDWIIEADIYRYTKAMRAEENHAVRAALAEHIRQAEARLAALRADGFAG